MRSFNPRWVVGRRITAVRLNATRASNGSTMHEPEIELDNGALLRFLTEEDPDGAEYGVAIIYLKPRKG